MNKKQQQITAFIQRAFPNCEISLEGQNTDELKYAIAFTPPAMTYIEVGAPKGSFFEKVSVLDDQITLHLTVTQQTAELYL